MARERGVTYVKLDGDVGILGNGAGLVMSTLDVVAQVGGRPANFLDVGGGAKAEEIVDALDVILADPKVNPSSSTSSAGSRAATRSRAASWPPWSSATVTTPIVVRLDGTSDVEGRRSWPRRARPT